MKHSGNKGGVKMAYPKISDLSCCPFCGHDEFYIKQSYKGNCQLNIRFDRKDNVDNSDLYWSAEHKIISKFAYCNHCDQKIAKIDDTL